MAEIRIGKGVKSPVQPSADLPASTEESLGDQLKAMFDHVAAQPLPADILALVDCLEGRKANSRAH